MSRIALSGLLAALLLAGPGGALAHEFHNDATLTPLLAQPLTDIARVGTMAVVELPPGGRTDPHRHPGSHTFVHVLEGELEMGVAGRPTVVLKTGQSYYEGPQDVHTVGRNPRDDGRTRFLVLFVHPADAPLLVPEAPQTDAAQP